MQEPKKLKGVMDDINDAADYPVALAGGMLNGTGQMAALMLSGLTYGADAIGALPEGWDADRLKDLYFDKGNNVAQNLGSVISDNKVIDGAIERHPNVSKVGEFVGAGTAGTGNKVINGLGNAKHYFKRADNMYPTGRSVMQGFNRRVHDLTSGGVLPASRSAKKGMNHLGGAVLGGGVGVGTVLAQEEAENRVEGM